MNVVAYIDAVRRTRKNLASLLDEWEDMDYGLRSHYVDSVLELFVFRDTAEDSASAEQLKELRKEWSLLINTSAPWAAVLFEVY